MAQQQKIIHVDMDAFYASVEQRDNPELQGRPVIVGGPPNSRGVVATASYEARRFGVHSAMPSSQAGRLCPHGVFVRPRFSVYKAVSQQIRAVFHEVTDLVEPLSLDEAYLDVTENFLGESSATYVAQYVRRRILEDTGLTASAGVAPNKFLAKLASDMDKPDGLTVIPPRRVEAVLKDLPVRRIWGVGAATEARMAALGIYTVSDLRRLGEARLVAAFGKAGRWYHNLAHGRDTRRVSPQRTRKSLGAEETYGSDLTDPADMHLRLKGLAARVADSAKRLNFHGRTVTLKVTYAGFTRISRSKTVEGLIPTAENLHRLACGLLADTDAGRRPVRLLGISIANPPTLSETDPAQLLLPLAIAKPVVAA